MYDDVLKARIYADASVVGGCEDDEFSEYSVRWKSGRHGRCCQMSRTEKKFDAGAMMRSIRERVSAQIDGMTLEEELAWLASQELKDPLLKRLRDRAAQQADAAADASRRR